MKAGGGAAAFALASSGPLSFVRTAWAEEFRNNPANAASIKLGFNILQTCSYAAELRAYKLAVNHLNGEGDGGMMKTFKPSQLKGNGILGTANWNWSLEDEGSKAFVKSFTDAYGEPPSQAAHTCYVQTLLYANAVETAGTFYPPEVIKALEGFKFDGMGNGETLYRAEDHQAFKRVLVVKGNEAPSSEFDLLKVVQEVPAEQVTYDPNIPQFKGDLGPYTPSAA